MMTLLKRAILQTLEQNGYLLLKKAQYNYVPVAELALYSNRIAELEEQNRQLTESATNHALRGQELERELLALRTEIATNDYSRLQAEHAFYSKRVSELEEHNRQLTESATKYALRAQKLERVIGHASPDFDDDDGTVEFASVRGLYVAGVEAPVAEDRVVTPAVANPAGTTVILTFGQSNAANCGEERYAARGAVHVFNIFDMRFYRAIDPLPGASVDAGCVYGGSVWGKLGDKLIDAGVAASVLIVPIAFGASYIEDWAPGGGCHRRLCLALHRLKSAGIKIDMLCWHQGEADANHTGMSAAEYSRHFHSMLRPVREAGIEAPVYVALATLCEGAPHPFQNRAAIRWGQKKVISIRDHVLPGPDTDLIGIEHRRDGCHFSASGQELAAQAWFNAITTGPLRTRMLQAKYRVQAYALAKAEEADGQGNRMRTLLKRLILRSLDRSGYVLLKKTEYGPPASIPLPSDAPASDQAPGPEAMPAAIDPLPTSPDIVPEVAPAAAVATPVDLRPAPAPSSAEAPSVPPLPPSPVQEFAPDSSLHADGERALASVKQKLALPLNQALAIYCAVRHLVRARIPGDIVDCGEGVPEVLAVVAASLVALGETTRRLVLFDVTSDFRHRPESEVPLWGTDYDLMSVQRPPPRPKQRVLPDALAASGYPADQIFIVRYPVDTIDLTRPIAFLALTAETYEANRAAVRTLAPRVSIGGVIAVEGSEHTPRAAIPGCVQHHLDAVAEFLKARGSDLPFWQVTDDYRLALKSRAFAEQD
jgi:carbohydrate esterase-like sialic acid-specific acetylesterase